VSKAAIKKCHLEGPKCYPRVENVPTTQSFGPQKKYFHAEQAIKKLKRYTEKGICLEDLQYKQELKPEPTMTKNDIR